jgi:hypothetical protein
MALPAVEPRHQTLHGSLRALHGRRGRGPRLPPQRHSSLRSNAIFLPVARVGRLVGDVGVVLAVAAAGGLHDTMVSVFRSSGTASCFLLSDFILFSTQRLHFVRVVTLSATYIGATCDAVKANTLAEDNSGIGVWKCEARMTMRESVELNSAKLYALPVGAHVNVLRRKRAPSHTCYGQGCPTHLVYSAIFFTLEPEPESKHATSA